MPEVIDRAENGNRVSAGGTNGGIASLRFRNYIVIHGGLNG